MGLLELETAPKEGLPLPAAITTLTQNILGAGVLALPYAFKSAGLAGGLLLLGLVYALSIWTMGALVLLSNHLGDFTYGGTAARTCGRRWSAVAETWVLCYNLGSCTAYPILLGDFLYSLAENFGYGQATNKLVCMVAAVAVICWPLSCAPSLGGLKWVSALGVMSIIFTSLAVVKRYADGSYPAARNQFSLFELDSFGDCFPILVGAFGAQFNIPTMFLEVAPGAAIPSANDPATAEKNFRRMMKVILAALTISGCVYGCVGAVVYATFGKTTKSNFTDNFQPDDAWLVVVRVTMTIAICASFPLTMVSARNAAFNLALRPRGKVMTPLVRIVLTTMLTALVLGLAAAAGDIGVVLTYSGSVFGTPVCYILPGAMFLLLPRPQRRGWRALCLICVIAGAIFGVLGVVVRTLELLKPSD